MKMEIDIITIVMAVGLVLVFNRLFPLKKSEVSYSELEKATLPL